MRSLPDLQTVFPNNTTSMGTVLTHTALKHRALRKRVPTGSERWEIRKRWVNLRKNWHPLQQKCWCLQTPNQNGVDLPCSNRTKAVGALPASFSARSMSMVPVTRSCNGNGTTRGVVWSFHKPCGWGGGLEWSCAIA